MQIFEQRAAWRAEYEAGWLAHFRETGETDFKRYNRPANDRPVGGRGVDLSGSRLVLISSAGSYLAQGQAPFDAADPLGDYTIRTFPSDTPPDALAFAQDHYNHAAVTQDIQVLVPLAHLHEMVARGVIGSLASNVISFHGYVPDVIRFVDETIPLILEAALAERAEAALLVPA